MFLDGKIRILDKDIWFLMEIFKVLIDILYRINQSKRKFIDQDENISQPILAGIKFLDRDILLLD